MRELTCSCKKDTSLDLLLKLSRHSVEFVTCIIPINCICWSDEGVVVQRLAALLTRMHQLLALFHFYIDALQKTKQFCSQLKRRPLGRGIRCSRLLQSVVNIG